MKILDSAKSDYIKSLVGDIRDIFDIDISVATFIACQSALETSYGCSHICKANLNFFGMKYPMKRLTSALLELNGHAAYPDRFCSIVDYFLYLQYNSFSVRCMDDLITFIDKLSKTKYNPDMDSYISTIKDVYIAYYCSLDFDYRVRLKVL